MRFKELQVVEIAIDIPESDLTEGMVATILDIHEEPEPGYEVEVVDRDFNTVYLGGLSEACLRERAEQSSASD